MQQDIAKAIGRGWSPELTEAMKLPERARRLGSALKVAEQWIEAAFAAQSVELTARAEYMRDQLEEDLSRVCFEMEVEERRAQYGEGHSEEAQHSAVSDTLLTAYTILREVPDSFFGSGTPRARYEVMGALLVAQDAANAEIETPEPREPEAKATA